MLLLVYQARPSLTLLAGWWEIVSHGQTLLGRLVGDQENALLDKSQSLKVPSSGVTVASFPGLPPFLPSFAFTLIHGSGSSAKNGEGLGAFITWMTSGGCEVDMGGGGVGGRVQLPKQHTRLSVRVLYRSFELQTLASSKLLVLIGKKHAFKFSMYIFECLLVSTHMNAPRPSLFFAAMCIIVSVNGR